MNQLVTTTKLTDLIAVSSWIIKGDSARMALRSMITRTTGLKPRETGLMRVFFRQNLTGVTFQDIFDELSQLSRGSDNSILHIEVQISPTIDIKETHWYQIIRYCLFCLGQANMANVVFEAPCSSKMDLYMLNSNLFDIKRLAKDLRRPILQMIAIKIGFWLTKPVYLSFRFHGQQVEKQTHYLQYVGKALYDALDHYQACTIKELKEILYTHFAIIIHFSRNTRRGNDVVLVSPVNVQLPSVNASEVGLCLDDIKVWMHFNHILKDYPIAVRVRRGVVPLF